MRMTSIIVAIAALAFTLSACTSRSAELDQAIAEAQQEGRVMVAYFTADWCPPCRMMKENTWPDERVTGWIEANGHLHTVDIDRNGDAAQSLGIRGIPTMVVFVDGREVDRRSGYVGPEDLVDWLDSFAARR